MQMNLIRFSGYINTLPSETFVHLSHDRHNDQSLIVLHFY